MSDSEEDSNRLPWPDLVRTEDSAARRQLVAEIRRQPPSSLLLPYLREALTAETDGSVADDLISAVLHHEDKEKQETDGSFLYGHADLARVYEDALKSATSTEVRCALHVAITFFRPKGAKDGRTSFGDLLGEKHRATGDIEEQLCLAMILKVRAGYSGERLLSLAERSMDMPLGDADAGERLSFWATVVKEARDDASPRDSERIRRRAVRKLQSLLDSDRESQVRDDMVALLAGDLYGPDSDETLLTALQDTDWEVRRAAVSGLAKIGDRGKEALRAHLKEEDDSDVIAAITDALRELGDDEVSLVRALAANPRVETVAASLFRPSSDPQKWTTLRRAWPALPASVRDALEQHRQRNLDHHQFLHPFWHELWWDLRESFRRDGRDPGWALIGSFLLRPLSELIGAYDLDAVTGLRRRATVSFRTVPTLRFAFLMHARTREGRPVTEMLDRQQFPIGELLQMERDLDGIRDRHAVVRSELDARARELGDEAIARLRDWIRTTRERPGRLPFERFGIEGVDFIKLEEELLSLEKQLSLDPEVSSFGRLAHQSRELLPYLQETGCSLEGMIGPDGILGEYQPRDRSITLFTTMIELATADVYARLSSGPSREELGAWVRTIVEIHELAHAQMHLGEDAGGRVWDAPGAASRGFHEAFAQLFTRKVVLAIDEPGIRGVLEVMEKWLPPEYRYADHFGAVDPEEVRSHLLRRRRESPAESLTGVLDAVLRSLPAYTRLLKAHLPPEVWTDLVTTLGRSLDMAAEGLAVPPEGPRALERLLVSLSALPQAKTILGAFVPGGLPDAERLRWLVFESLVAGEPVGDGALRYLRAEDFVAAVESSKPSAMLGLRAGITEARTAVEEVRALGPGRTDDLLRQPASVHLAAAGPGDGT